MSTTLCRRVEQVMLIVAVLKWRTPVVALLHLRRLGWWGLAACVFVAAQSFCIVTALRLTTVANVALLVNTSPAFTAALDYCFLRESLPLRTKLMIVGGMLSVGIILGSDVAFAADNMVGNLTALGNPASWACYWAIVRKRSKQLTCEAEAAVAAGVGTSTMQSSGTLGKSSSGTIPHDKWDDILLFQLGYGIICAVVATVFNVVTMAWPSEVATINAPIDWLWYFCFGGLCLPICVCLFSLAPSYISTSEMSCIKMMEVAIAPMYALWYEAAEPSTGWFLGSSILVLSIVLHSFFSMPDAGPKKAKTKRGDDIDGGAPSYGGLPPTSAELAGETGGGRAP
jgi:drug/metabolite transporter (DMT)-like permease